MTFTVGGKHRLSRALTGLLVVCAVFSGGCYKATGGGWIPSFYFPLTDKATFGFTAKCRNTQQNGDPFANLYEGQLEWNDGPVRLHGDVDALEPIPGRCEELDLMTDGGPMVFTGTYRPQGGGEPGFFRVDVDDLGEPGVNGDLISIQVLGGLYDAYVNSGVLRGGNIQVF